MLCTNDYFFCITRFNQFKKDVETKEFIASAVPGFVVIHCRKGRSRHSNVREKNKLDILILQNGVFSQFVLGFIKPFVAFKH